MNILDGKSVAQKLANIGGGAKKSVFVFQFRKLQR
jgi:hypothetical protein